MVVVIISSPVHYVVLLGWSGLESGKFTLSTTSLPFNFIPLFSFFFLVTPSPLFFQCSVEGLILGLVCAMHILGGCCCFFCFFRNSPLLAWGMNTASVQAQIDHVVFVVVLTCVWLWLICGEAYLYSASFGWWIWRACFCGMSLRLV